MTENIASRQCAFLTSTLAEMRRWDEDPASRTCEPQAAATSLRPASHAIRDASGAPGLRLGGRKAPGSVETSEGRT